MKRNAFALALSLAAAVAFAEVQKVGPHAFIQSQWIHGGCNERKVRLIVKPTVGWHLNTKAPWDAEVTSSDTSIEPSIVIKKQDEHEVVVSFQTKCDAPATWKLTYLVTAYLCDEHLDNCVREEIDGSVSEN